MSMNTHRHAHTHPHNAWKKKVHKYQESSPKSWELDLVLNVCVCINRKGGEYAV